MSIELETSRLRLRQFRGSDFERYSQMLADPEIMKYISQGSPLNRDEAWNNLALLLGHWKLKGYGLWAVELKQNNQLIGRIGLYNPAGWPGTEVGWMLMRAYWGNGYAKEGAAKAAQYAFETLKLHKLISIIHPENTASIRVAEHLGGIYKNPVIIDGTRASLYGINQEAFQQKIQHSEPETSDNKPNKISINK